MGKVVLVLKISRFSWIRWLWVFGKQNIEWDHNGHVVLGDDVTISWGNIANTPGWIDDWDSNKTVIGGESLITPKSLLVKNRK